MQKITEEQARAILKELGYYEPMSITISKLRDAGLIELSDYEQAEETESYANNPSRMASIRIEAYRRACNLYRKHIAKLEGER